MWTAALTQASGEQTGLGAHDERSGLSLKGIKPCPTFI